MKAYLSITWVALPTSSSGDTPFQGCFVGSVFQVLGHPAAKGQSWSFALLHLPHAQLPLLWPVQQKTAGAGSTFIFSCPGHELPQLQFWLVLEMCQKLTSDTSETDCYLTRIDEEGLSDTRGGILSVKQKYYSVQAIIPQNQQDLPDGVGLVAWPRLEPDILWVDD